MAKPEDAAVLNTAPEKGAGSSPAARSQATSREGVVDDVEVGGAVPVEDEGAVQVGSVVHVQDGMLDEWLRIVASHDADAMRRWYSEETPLARALLGHRAGERVSVRGPGAAPRMVSILAVQRPRAQDAQ